MSQARENPSNKSQRDQNGPSLEDFDVPSLLESIKQEYKDAHRGVPKPAERSAAILDFQTDSGLHIQLKPPGQFLYDGKRFCSRGEAAVDAALHKNLSSRYSYDPGLSYEVPVGLNEKGHVQTVDFRIGNFLIEYHPPRFWTKAHNHGDFSSPKEAREFRRLIFSSDLNRTEKRFVREVMRERLTENYTRRRLALIKANPELRDCKLIVVTDAESLYQNVIKRFTDTKLPGLEKFQEEFNEVASRVVDLSPGQKKRENARQNRREERQAYRRKGKEHMRRLTNTYNHH